MMPRTTPRKRTARKIKSAKLSVAVDVKKLCGAKPQVGLGLGLLHAYGVLRNIFHHLPVADLLQVSQVCREWQEVTKLEVASRKGSAQWYTFHEEGDLEEWKGSITIMRHQPAICFTFSTTSFRQHQKVVTEIRKVVEKLKCDLISIIAVDLLRATYFREHTLVESWYPVQYCLLFPTVPGVRIMPFRLTWSACRKLGEGENGIPQDLLDIGPDMPLKCLLFFCTKSGLYASRLAVQLQKRQEEGIAIGGVCLPKVQINGDAELICGVAIYGESVMASSTVFHDSVNCPLAVDNQMRRYRDRVIETSIHDMAFMFCCHSRCYRPRDPNGQCLEIEKECSREAAAFRRHFTTPNFIGILGSGEIGCTCLPVDGEVKPVSLEVDKLRLTYSVVLVHISFDVPKPLRKKQQTQSLLCRGLE